MSESAAPPLKVAPEINGAAAGSEILPPQAPSPPTLPNEQQDCITAKPRLWLTLTSFPPGMSPVCPSAPSLHPSSSPSLHRPYSHCQEATHLYFPRQCPPAGPPHAERAAIVAADSRGTCAGSEHGSSPETASPPTANSYKRLSFQMGGGGLGKGSHQYARRRLGSPATRRNDCQCTVGR